MYVLVMPLSGIMLCVGRIIRTDNNNNNNHRMYFMK